MHLRCPHCQNAIELADLPSAGEITCTGCGSSFQLDKFATATLDQSTIKRIGKFEVLGTLGQGAFGTVVKARDTELDRIVAIKIPRAGNIGTAPQDVDRFLREARSVAQLRFPSIITIHEVGADNGVPYLVCDFVEGVTLADLLTSRRPTFHETAKLLAEVADALQYAHSLGVVHRDVKPSNIMIRPDGSPCVMDFGLAKREAGEITMTIDGQILGTPAYMSPEQARGEGHQVDGRSDVYSLGVILYQLLTGELPFRGNKAMLLHQVLQDEPLRPRTLNDKIPRDLETISLKAMAKEPGRRYASAKEMADDLRSWLAGEPILARPVGTLERTWRWCQRKPALAIASGVAVCEVLLALVTFATAFFVVSASLSQEQTQRKNAEKLADENKQHALKEEKARMEASAALARAEHEKRQRAIGQVNALRDAAPGAVPAILGELQANRATVLPHLRERYAQEKGRPKRIRLALALVADEPATLRDELAAWMLQVDDPAEVLLIRDALAPHKRDLLGRLWTAVETPDKGNEKQRLRAAAALATYDPDSPRWDQARDHVVEDFVAVNPVFLGSWSDAFRPVRGRLLSPLSVIYRDHQPQRAAERTLATNLLADYAVDQPQVLADLLMDADEKQFAVIYAKFKDGGEQGLPLLTGEIDKTLPPELPSSDDGKEKLAQRQANAAVALLKLNQPDKVWPLLKHSPDPRTRSYLIHRLSPLGADAKVIVNRLDRESDVTIRRALILSLGAYGEKELSLEDRKELLPRLQEMYRSDTDPGLHSSAEWLLRTWKQEAWLKQVNDEWASDKAPREKRLEDIQQLLTKDKEKTPPQWYVNGQAQTMVVMPGPVEFVMGSPLTEAYRSENEVQHKKRISRTFALAATAVTKEQFLRYQPKFSHNEMRRYPEPTCPIGGVLWYEAARYCNWLSKEEGIDEDQWCFEIKGKEVKLKANYLGLSGYRLPTEAEMEYATRAGALTSRYFGETEEFFAKYAWYQKNSKENSWPVGSLKPNDLGLFDVHGNMFTWCQEGYKKYPIWIEGEAVEDREDELEIVGTRSRMLRGGATTDPISRVRSAYRFFNPPTARTAGFGLRVARTLPPGAFR